MPYRFLQIGTQNCIFKQTKILLSVTLGARGGFFSWRSRYQAAIVESEKIKTHLSLGHLTKLFQITPDNNNKDNNNNNNNNNNNDNDNDKDNDKDKDKDDDNDNDNDNDNNDFISSTSTGWLFAY